MVINSYKKKRNGFYELCFNEKRIEVHEDLILKYELLLKKEISEELETKIISENVFYEIYNFSIKQISTRIRSTFELENILSKKKYDTHLIDEVVILLTKQGYLNDNMYAMNYINDRIKLSNDGPNKIKNNLIANKIDMNIVEKHFSIFDYNLEFERANKLISKLIKANRNKGKNIFLQKTKYHLINLGYNKNVIDDCLSNVNFDDSIIAKKEYEKLYKQFSKKYTGNELAYKIKQRLYQKGLSYEVE